MNTRTSSRLGGVVLAAGICGYSSGQTCFDVSTSACGNNPTPVASGDLNGDRVIRHSKPMRGVRAAMGMSRGGGRDRGCRDLGRLSASASIIVVAVGVEVPVPRQEPESGLGQRATGGAAWRAGGRVGSPVARGAALRCALSGRRCRVRDAALIPRDAHRVHRRDASTIDLVPTVATLLATGAALTAGMLQSCEHARCRSSALPDTESVSMP